MNELKAAAVFMYVHNAFDADIENALIAWTERGGRLIVVHHGMASGRMKNERWPGFLGVRILPRDDPQYPWKVFRGVFEVVNLNPAHFITSNKVQWPKTTQYTPSDGRSKTVLLGMKGDVEGRAIMQDRAAWLKPAGKGWIVYFQMGHESRDFENGSFMQMIENALRWKP